VDLLVANATSFVRVPNPAASHRAVRCAVLVALAAVCGASWSWGRACAISPLVVVAWWRAQTRVEALLVGAAYQLGATLNLATAASLWFEVPFVVAAALIVGVAVVVGACWAVVVPARCSAMSAIGAVLLWATLTVAPIVAGACMVGHPLIAAGLWCPGAGWLGLAVLLGLIVLARTRVGACTMAAWCFVAIVVNARSHTAAGIGAINTASKPARDEFDFMTHYSVARAALDVAELERAKLVVFPESAGGTWTAPMRELWAPYSARLKHEGRAGLVGAVLQRTDGRLENVVVGLGELDGEVVSQRLPIPVAMWRPWADEGFVARPWDAGVVAVNDERLGVLVCWEGALVWPALRSMAAGATSLVLLANHGWTGPRAETRRALEAWGALFNVPVAMAENVWREQ